MNPGVPAALAVVVAGVALRPRPIRLLGSAPASAVSGSSRLTKRFHLRWRPVSRSAVEPAAATARWCTELARAVRSGSSLAMAVRATSAPAHAPEAIGAVALALDRGASLTAALDAAAGHDAELDLALTVLRACAAHGGPPGEPLDRAAATLRGRAADRAERRTHSAQARLSAVVMTWLPIAMLLVLLTTSASVRAAVARPTGGAVLVLGGALNLIGWRWMRRIIGSST